MHILLTAGAGFIGSGENDKKGIASPLGEVRILEPRAAAGLSRQAIEVHAP